MRAYTFIRFANNPDVADIKSQGRASHVGRFAEKGGDFKSYTRRPNVRRSARRLMKRRDARLIARFEAQAEGVN